MADQKSASKSTTDGLQITGTTLQAFGSFMSNQETARGFKLNATEIVREGLLAAERIRLMGERVQSAQQVGFIKGGVELSGTPLEVMAETVNRAELDALETERAAYRQARELRRAAKRAKAGGLLGVGGAIVGGMIGGPAGAVIGSQVGSMIGSSQ